MPKMAIMEIEIIIATGPATKGDWTISASHGLSNILLEPTLP